MSAAALVTGAPSRSRRGARSGLDVVGPVFDARRDEEAPAAWHLWLIYVVSAVPSGPRACDARRAERNESERLSRAVPACQGRLED